MINRLLPVITETDRQLPYYLIDAGFNWNQEHVISKNGYYFQWIQSIQGEGELVVNGKTYLVKEGCAMLLYKGIPHEYYAISSSWIVNWVVFDGQQVKEFLNNIAGIDTSVMLYLARPDVFLNKFQSMADIGHSESTLTGIKYSSIIYCLLTDIVQYASINNNNDTYNQYFKLKPIFDYIEQNYAKALTLEELADVIGVTPPHLCTSFKKATNLRPFQYINSIRIKKSKELLLENPQLQIKEVAYLAGFEDPTYFCSVFKKHEKINPSQFRRLHF